MTVAGTCFCTSARQPARHRSANRCLGITDSHILSMCQEAALWQATRHVGGRHLLGPPPLTACNRAAEMLKILLKSKADRAARLAPS